MFIRNVLQRTVKLKKKLLKSSNSNYSFWNKHNVTSHNKFSSREESLNYLDWRNSQYLFYEDLSPFNKFNDKVVLDYGCGPGNDIVGFIEYSYPKKVIGMDISKNSIEEARQRVLLHQNNKAVELILIQDGISKLPLDDNSVDYIHSSGVLHHIPNLHDIFNEFYRILKPNGYIRIMVYNYDSIWLHLYVAYLRQIVNRIDHGIPLLEAFKRSTDGEDCPISRCYKKNDFINIGMKSGFVGKFIGSAISLNELNCMSERFKALEDIRLDKEHRDFLKSLEFDKHSLPIYNGDIAGIDAVYEFKK